MTTSNDKRVAYGLVGVQLALLALIFLLPGRDDWHTPGWLFTAAGGLQLVGLIVLLVALANLGRSLTPLPTPVENGELREGGMYRFVRHPIYAAIMALTAGGAIRSQSVPVAIATVALAAWLSVKARWEERRLSARYPGYAAYALRTPRFVPFPRRGGPAA